MNTDYPKLVHPAILKKLNEEVFSVLRLPIFLNTDPLPLYSLKESKHSFPALAAMLFCIYRDYSKGLLDICLKEEYIPPRLQSDSTLMTQRKRGADHYKDICHGLRNGFYHGYYPGHELGIKFPGILGNYTGAVFSTDNSLHKNIKGVDCKGWEMARKKLIGEADDLYAYIKEWKDQMASLDEGQREACRKSFINALPESWIDRCFVKYILNGLLLQQGRRQEVYDRTYMKGLSRKVEKINQKIKDKILAKNIDGGFEKPEHVYMELVDMIENDICPESQFPNSDDIENTGFEISLLKPGLDSRPRFSAD